RGGDRWVAAGGRGGDRVPGGVYAAADSAVAGCVAGTHAERPSQPAAVVSRFTHACPSAGGGGEAARVHGAPGDSGDGCRANPGPGGGAGTAGRLRGDAGSSGAAAGTCDLSGGAGGICRGANG